jgi:hypothetical protein
MDMGGSGGFENDLDIDQSDQDQLSTVDRNGKS